MQDLHPLSYEDRPQSLSSSPQRKVSWKSPFISTKQYIRFSHFCDASRHYRTIDICQGPSGTGKTTSARVYASWDFFEQQLPSQDIRSVSMPARGPLPHTILYTPPVAHSIRRLENELRALVISIVMIADSLMQNDSSVQTQPAADCIELLIIDEATRLNKDGYEVLRDLHNRYHLGIILIGIPGIEQRLRSVEQISSQIRSTHIFPHLEHEEVRRVLQRKFLLGQFPLQYETDITDEMVSLILHKTAGNFQRINILLMHIDDILFINRLPALTLEVLDAAFQNMQTGRRWYRGIDERSTSSPKRDFKK